MSGGNNRKGKGFSGLSDLASDISPLNTVSTPELSSQPTQPSQPSPSSTMVSGNSRKGKGFSGLSDLATDVSTPNTVSTPELSSHHQPSQPSSPSSTTTNRPERQGSGSARKIETVRDSTSGSGSGWKWIPYIIASIFVIYFAAIVIWLANNDGEKSTDVASYTPPTPTQTIPTPPTPAQTTPTQSYNFPQSSPVPIAVHDNSQNIGLQYEKPSVGTDNILSVPQICWCVRENIRIETTRDFISSKRDLVSSKDAADEFNRMVKNYNRMVNDYNSRCGSYRYSPGSLERAQQEVEANRRQIVAKAVSDAGNLGRTYQSRMPNVQLTIDAQKLLTELGYDPGPIDGQYGHRTADAVKAFQQAAGLTQDGWIDENLLGSLRQAKAL